MTAEKKIFALFPFKKRIGKEQFSQDTPLFSWQQELYCWDCLQSHVTNTSGFSCLEPMLQILFFSDSTMLIGFILWTPDSHCPIPLQKGRQLLFNRSSEAKNWSCQSQDMSRACRAKVFLQLHLYSSVTSSIVMDVILYIRKNDWHNKIYWSFLFFFQHLNLRLSGSIMSS